jgi:hypothetical protein
MTVWPTKMEDHQATPDGPFVDTKEVEEENTSSTKIDRWAEEKPRRY